MNVWDKAGRTHAVLFPASAPKTLKCQNPVTHAIKRFESVFILRAILRNISVADLNVSEIET